MSDKPIQVGDLVQVVRGHACLLELRGGAAFVVEELVRPVGGGWTCGRCGERDLGSHDAYGAAGIGRAPVKIDQPFKHLTSGTSSIPLSWLKRIPPLEELDDVKQTDELTV